MLRRKPTEDNGSEMGKKVLVVDDNGYNLLLEKDLLEVAGFEVSEAEEPEGRQEGHHRNSEKIPHHDQTDAFG